MSPKHLPRDRAWGTRYDTLGISPPSSPPAQRSATAEPAHTPTTSALTQGRPLRSPDGQTCSAPPTERSAVQDGTRTPHDSSIFVGSLPASVDHGELTQRLSDHLSAYSQIKAIKVVRDSRGGVCAFVQCESPSSAGDLLQSLQTDPPRPFLGRFLRFEPAKAFRTLLISYRAPACSVPLSSSSSSITAGGRSADSRLASAMRIFRPRNGKYLGLLYDTDAINFTTATPDETLDDPRSDSFSGDGLLIHPLKYDAETLHKLVGAFGPLESFEKHSPEQTEGVPAEGSATIRSPNPFPHDASLSPEMATGIWEVKWKDREDSVVALLTLRRVPHLTVSWAHHPASTGTPSTGSQKTSVPMSPGSWVSPGRGRHFDVRSISGGNQLPPGGPLILHTPSALGPHAFISPTPSPKGETIPPPTWTTTGSPSPSTRFSRASAPNTTRWADQVTEFYEGNMPSLSSLSVHASTSGHASIDKTTPVSRPNTGLSAVRSHYKSSLTNLPATPGSDIDHPPADNTATTRGCTIGIAHPATQLRLHAAPRLSQEVTNRGVLPFVARDWRREIDPSTVFVGGLDMPGREAWDESKLRRIFERFGSIENVHIVRPLNKRTAFAFVRFANAEAATRAVQEEHNRVHDGYPIRVQLRDRSAVSRGTWRPGRGRGRALFGSPHLEREDSTFGSAHGFGFGEFQATSSPAMPQDRSTTSVASLQQELETTPPRNGHESHNLTDDALRSRGLQDAADSSASSVSSSTTKVPSLRYETSQGAPSTTASLTPPPSSASASTSVSSSLPIAPYQMNMGYFPPQPWVQPYAPPYPYAVPIVPGYGYPTYPYPPLQSVAPTFFTRESGISPTTSVSGATWSNASVSENVYKDMTSCDPRPPVGTPIHTHPSMMQPPLRATGFIQNEHGTLIPVYQREALDQYMANAHGRQLPPSQSRTPPQAGTPFASPASTTWHPPATLPLCPAGYPVSMAGAGPLPIPPPPSMHPPAQSRFWAPGSIPYGVAALGSSHPPVTTPLLSTTVAPVSTPHAPAFCRPHIGQRSGPPPRRLARLDHYNVGGNSNNGTQNSMGVVDYSRPVSRNFGHHYRRL